MKFIEGRLYRGTRGNKFHAKGTLFVSTGIHKVFWGIACSELEVLTGENKGKKVLFSESTPYLVPYIGKDPREIPKGTPPDILQAANTVCGLKVSEGIETGSTLNSVSSGAKVGRATAFPVSKPFGAALAHLKVGQRVARKGWNGKGMYLKFLGHPFANEGDFLDAEHFALEPTIVMKTAQNTYVAWTASQPDLLAEDWYVLKD